MKSSTYGTLVILLFLRYPKNVSKSIESVIRMTDQLCEKFGINNTLSHMTKYRIIAELITYNILDVYTTEKNKKIFLSKKTTTFIKQKTQQ